MTANPQSVGAFAHRLNSKLTALSQAAAVALNPAPGRVVAVAPGAEVAWDDCCDGQVWARLVTFQPLPSAGAARKPGTDPCAVPHFVATVELGVTRCAATQDKNGNAPAAERVAADGLQGIADMAALLGVLRCPPPGVEIRDLGSWTPQGPNGGCFGGVWTFTLRVGNCIECEAA